MVVKIEANANGSHSNQFDTPYIISDGWIVVPPHLEADFISSGFFCDLEVVDGVLVGITPTERPVEPEPVPETDPQEDTDALLVDHELRLTLLELGGV